MKFFKVILNTVGKDNEKVLFIIPPADETDENGNPAYDEDFLLSNAEYKSYLKETKAAVVSVTYILYEADNRTKLNYDELLKSEHSFFKVEQNEYLIEVKKAKPKGGGKKSPTAMYIVLGVIAVAVVVMMIYGGGLKSGGNIPVNSESDTSDMSVDTNSTLNETEEPTIVESETSEEISSDLTVTAETSSETETTAPTSTTVSEPPVTTTAEDPAVTTTAEAIVFTLTFDKNGGVGSLNENEYTGGTVVELPFMGVSRIGYTLMGWATAPTEPYTLYDNETSKYIMPSAPATLYAIWTAAEYEVIYNYQIGADSVTSKERGKYGEIIQLRDISNVASDAGEFVGWGLLPNADEPVQSLTMPDGGIELYAIYKKAE